MNRSTFAAGGKQVLRDDAHFLDAASPEIAAALAITLDRGAIVFGSDTSVEDQQMVQKVLWP